MAKEEYETEGNLVTAFVAAVVFPKNLLKATGGVLIDKVFGNGDGKPLMDRLDEHMGRDCEPFCTTKRKK